jgi:hypothetical protein
MTIALSANTPRISYTVNQGVTQTSFTVPFVFFTTSTDLNVFVDNTARTFDASTANTTQYTVSGGNGSTGSITTSVTGGTGGSTVVITRAVPLSRTTDFPSSGAFEVAKLNTELDTVTAIQSDFNDQASRGIRLKDSDVAVSMELPLKADRIGTVLGFNASTGAAEAGPTITAVQSLSAVTASINLLGTSAVVEDMGLLATSAVIEDMGLLATSGNVTAMGLLGTSDVVADMALLGTSDVVADMALLATSDVISDMNTLATSDIITDLNTLATSDIVTDMNLLATSANVTAMGHLGTSDNVTAMGLLGTSAVVTDLDLLGTSGNVTAMGHLGTSANVTAMGLLGTSTVVTDMGILGTAAIVEDMGILATSANVTAMGLLGTSAVVEDMGLLGTSAVVEDLGLLATSAVIEDMGLLATSANVTNMATLGASGVVTNIATVASNVSGVNSFADRYRVASSDPSSNNDEGDLVYNTTDNNLKFFNGSSFVSVGGAISNIVEDSSPQLGSSLDVNGNSIVSASNGNIAITPNGSGKVVIDGISHPTSDGSAGQFLKTDGSGALSFASVELFPSGTSMLFQQTAAPTGWTKQTTHNDKSLRIVSGTVGTGGSVAFSTAMATPAVAGGSVSGDPASNLAVSAGNLAVSMSGNISSTTLSVNQIPSHTHQNKKANANNPASTLNNDIRTQGPAINVNQLPITAATGGGGSHNHGHNLSGSMSGAPSLSGNVTSGNLAVGASTATINVQYVDFIIANKD